ncbi:MAG TPA: peptide chain release factor 2, partial [Acidimicrobiales bacterium]|nr:peptide chain release factor 2 [Acidimicrobiales bacterium]
MKDFTDQLREERRRLSELSLALDIEGKRKRLSELEARASDPGLWDDADAARSVTTEMARLKDDVELVEGLERRLSDAEVLFQLGRDESDDSVEPELDAAVAALVADLDALELRSLYTGDHDERDAVCEVHSGAGGTDSQDWAEMLLRMYLRWAERRGFDVEVDEVSPGAEAGITSATFIVRGRYAYGLLSSEKGVHRLVRISPFDAQSRRHTAFASFDAVPFLEEAGAEVEIDEKDLRVDTYRSSGAGGQHVNVTDSAVRITHLPTGIVVSCQNQRSQHQNKAVALQILAAKLADRAREERRQELEALAGEQREVAWGSQIRSYWLHPNQLVKDLRTGHETGNIGAVLDGDLDAFMEAFLRWRRRTGMLAPQA